MSLYGMKTELECLPCFYGQISRTLNYAGVNGGRAREIMHKAEAIIAASSLDDVPARTTTVIHRLLRQETGLDPYQQVKDIYNRVALEMLPDVQKRSAETIDPLEGPVRAAIAGNVIDFGIYEKIDLARSVRESFKHALPVTAFRSFTRAINRAHRIFYLCDNAGEIVFDRVLLEALIAIRKKMTVAVKGSPVINDATLDDAAAAGLPAFTDVIDNGNDGIGTLLEACAPRFMDEYRAADLIISKGQANFETLAQSGDERIFFLFKVKCPVVAGALGRENGDIVVMQNG